MSGKQCYYDAQGKFGCGANPPWAKPSPSQETKSVTEAFGMDWMWKKAPPPAKTPAKEAMTMPGVVGKFSMLPATAAFEDYRSGAKK
jgi:hypothetical protein